MQVQLFRFARAKVRGPMGVYEEERMSPAGATSISHGGREYQVDESGWIEVPLDVYAAISRHTFAQPGGGKLRYVTPAEVDEQVRLGLASAEALPKKAPARPSAQRQARLAKD